MLLVFKAEGNNEVTNQEHQVSKHGNAWNNVNMCTCTKLLTDRQQSMRAAACAARAKFALITVVVCCCWLSYARLCLVLGKVMFVAAGMFGHSQRIVVASVLMDFLADSGQVLISEDAENAQWERERSWCRQSRCWGIFFLQCMMFHNLLKSLTKDWKSGWKPTVNRRFVDCLVL